MAKKHNTPATEETRITKADLNAAVAAPLAVNPLVSGFQDASAFVMPEGAVVRSMSPLVRPAEFPVGKVLVGRFAKMFTTNPSKGKKGEGIDIIPDGAQVGIALPAVATLRQGLEISGSGDEAKSPHLGKRVAIQRFAEKLKSKKGQDAWHFVVAILPEPTPKNS